MVLKPLFTALAAKGYYDGSHAEEVSGAVALLIWGIATHFWHGKKPTQGNASGSQSNLNGFLIGGLACSAIAFAAGCSTISNNTFAAEYSAAAAVDASMKGYAAYWDAAIQHPAQYNRTSAGLYDERHQVEDYAKTVGNTIAQAESLRRSFVTNSAVEPTLKAAEDTMGMEVAALSAMVANFQTNTNPVTK